MEKINFNSFAYKTVEECLQFLIDALTNPQNDPKDFEASNELAYKLQEALPIAKKLNS